jgi:hypothetical protein
MKIKTEEQKAKEREYQRKYREANREKKLEYARGYRQDPENKARANEYAKEYYGEHKEQWDEYAKRNAQKRKEYARQYYLKNRDKLCAYSRDWSKKNNDREHLATRPRADFCEVCGRFDENRSGYRTVFDHDHATGKFRGWLCSRCNTALGLLEDRSDWILLLVEYLSKNQSTQPGCTDPGN